VLFDQRPKLFSVFFRFRCVFSIFRRKFALKTKLATMERRHSRHELNEVVIFLVNLFSLEVLGKFAVDLALFLLRLFGMERLSQAYYAMPRHGYYTFFIFLCIATLISIYRVAKTQRDR